MSEGAIKSNLFRKALGKTYDKQYLLKDVFAEHNNGPLIFTVSEATPGFTTFPELAWEGFSKMVRKVDKEFGVDAVINLGSINHDYIDSIEEAPKTKVPHLPFVTHEAFTLEDRFKLLKDMHKGKFGNIPFYAVLGDFDNELLKIRTSHMRKDLKNGQLPQNVGEKYFSGYVEGEKNFPILRLIPDHAKIDIENDSWRMYMQEMEEAIPNLEKVGGIRPSEINGDEWIKDGAMQGSIRLKDKWIKYRHRWAGATGNPLKYTYAKWMHGEVGDLTDLEIPDLVIQGHDGTHEHSAIIHSKRKYKYLLQTGVFEDYREVNRLKKEGYRYLEAVKRKSNFPSYGVSFAKLDDAPIFGFASQELLEKIATDNKFDILGQDYLVQHRQSDNHIGGAVRNARVHQMSIKHGMNTHVDQYINTGDVLAGNGMVYPEFWVENTGDLPDKVTKVVKSKLESIVNEDDAAVVAELVQGLNNYLFQELQGRNQTSLDKQILQAKQIFNPYFDHVRRVSRLEKNGIIIAPGNHPDHTAGRSSGMHPELLMLEMYRERLDTLEELGELKRKNGFVPGYDELTWDRLGYAEPEFGLPGGFSYLEMCAHKIKMKKGLAHDRAIGIAQYRSVKPNPKTVFQDETGEVYNRFTGFNAGHYHYNWGLILTDKIKTEDGSYLLPVMINDPGAFAESNAYSVQIGWKDATVGDQRKYLPKHGPNSGLLMTRMMLSDYYLKMWDEHQEDYRKNVQEMAKKDLERL